MQISVLLSGIDPRLFFLFALASSLPSMARAQDPTLAPENLRFTSGVVARNGFKAEVILRTGRETYVHYGFERHAERSTIRAEGGKTYARADRKPWIEEGGSAKAGEYVDDAKEEELDGFATIAESVFKPFVDKDSTQGGAVWRLVGEDRRSGVRTFIYERSREKPREDGVYPRFTFLKTSANVDGRLLLQRFTGQLFMGTEVVPFEIEFEYPDRR